MLRSRAPATAQKLLRMEQTHVWRGLLTFAERARAAQRRTGADTGTGRIGVPLFWAESTKLQAATTPASGPTLTDLLCMGWAAIALSTRAFSFSLRVAGPARVDTATCFSNPPVYM
jgi:hypothetical protein